MKKIFLAVMLIAVLLVGSVISTQAAMSQEEVTKKLTGTWKLVTSGGMYQQFNMFPPGYLSLYPNNGKWFFWLTIKGKGKLATKGNKWEVKVPATTGGAGTIYLYQTHVLLGGRWKAAKAKAGGPVEFMGGKKAKISFLNLAKYAVPDAGNDFISLTWTKIKDM